MTTFPPFMSECVMVILVFSMTSAPVFIHIMVPFVGFSGLTVL